MRSPWWCSPSSWAPYPRCRPSPTSVLGAYTGYGNAAADQAIGTELGHPLAFGSDYIPYTGGWAGMVDPRIESLWAHSGLRMVYGLPMFPDSCGISRAACWNAGAAGDYDSYFSQIARNLVNNGQGNAILRLGWEFNVPQGYAWYAGGYAPQFVRYWRDIVTAMRAVPGADFSFDWNPNIGATLSDLTSYYPGDAYVEAIGVGRLRHGLAGLSGAAGCLAAGPDRGRRAELADFFRRRARQAAVLARVGSGDHHAAGLAAGTLAAATIPTS